MPCSTIVSERPRLWSDGSRKVIWWTGGATLYPAGGFGMMDARVRIRDHAAPKLYVHMWQRSYSYRRFQ